MKLKRHDLRTAHTVLIHRGRVVASARPLWTVADGTGAACASCGRAMVEGEAVVQGGKPAGAKRPVVNCGDCLPWHPYGHYRMPEEERAALEDAGAELGCPDCLSGTLGRRLHSSDEALLMARAVEKDLRVRLKQLVDERAGGYRALAEREKAVGDLLWRARRVLRVAEGDRLRTELESVLDAAMQELGWGGAVLRPPERPHRSSAGRAG